MISKNGDRDRWPQNKDLVGGGSQEKVLTFRSAAKCGNKARRDSKRVWVALRRFKLRIRTALSQMGANALFHTFDVVIVCFAVFYL